MLIVLPFVLMAACHSGGAGVDPAPAADASLRTFLRAASDSDLVAMAGHWGTSRGPAGETRVPPDYQKRIAIMQVYLGHYNSRVVANQPSQDESNQRILQVELSRPGCLKVVPFTMIRAGNQWLVYRFDLERIGNPQRSCAPSDSTS